VFTYRSGARGTSPRQRQATGEINRALPSHFSFLPADATPPLDLNKETVDRYRPEMRKFYLNKTAEFK